MHRINQLLVILLVTGCTNGPDHATRKNSPSSAPQLPPDSTPIFTSEELKENFIPNENGVVTIEGLLEGSWLRLRTGETLGDHSKATILDPLRLKIGSRTLPLVGITDDLAHTLLKNSGKTVRLSGHLTRWIEHGRGNQNPQAGYTGPIPAHVVEFMNVSACDVIVPKAE